MEFFVRHDQSFRAGKIGWSSLHFQSAFGQNPHSIDRPRGVRSDESSVLKATHRCMSRPVGFSHVEDTDSPRDAARHALLPRGLLAADRPICTSYLPDMRRQAHALPRVWIPASKACSLPLVWLSRATPTPVAFSPA